MGEEKREKKREGRGNKEGRLGKEIDKQQIKYKKDKWKRKREEEV